MVTGFESNVDPALLRAEGPDPFRDLCRRLCAEYESEAVSMAYFDGPGDLVWLCGDGRPSSSFELEGLIYFRKTRIGLVRLTRKLAPYPADASARLQETLAQLAPEFTAHVRWIQNRVLSRALQCSVERELSLLYSSLDPMITIDTSGRITEMNASAERVFGYKASETSGQPLTMLAPTLSDPAAFIEELQTTGGRRKNGCLFPMELLVSEMPSLDGPAYVCIARDLTQRFEADEALSRLEHRHRAFLDAIPDLLFRIRRDGMFLDFKAPSTQATSYPLEFLLGSAVQDIFPDSLATPLMELIEKAIQTGGHQTLAYGLDIHGKTRSFEARLVHNAGDEVLMISRDVTTQIESDRQLASYYEEVLSSRTRLEEQARELEKALHAARTATEAKSDFLATMSHELRTPMNAVIGMTGLLAESELKSEQREYVGLIRRSGEALLDIIDEILDYSKIEAGKMSLEPIPFDIATLLEDVTDLLSVRAAEKSLKLMLRFAPDMPRQVVGDPGRLRQIVINLVGNAIKFTPSGFVLIEARGIVQNDTEVRCEISVKDTGIGIATNQIPRLFEQFTQADNSTTRKYGGTGLGLAISKRLVELMGGAISAQSVEGKGSRFQFSAVLGLPAGPFLQHSCRMELHRKKILIADPDPISAIILREQLASFGVFPDVVDSCEEVARRLAASSDPCPFDLLLIDGDLPEVLRVIAETSAGRPAPRVIVSTWKNRPSDANCWRMLGCDGYLVRPVPSIDLMDAISQILLDRHSGIITRQGIRDQRKRASSQAITECDSALPGHLRILVAEDNPINQKVIKRLLEKLGCSGDLAAHGREAIALWERLPYHMILLDCQMPEMDGYETAIEIRRRETGGSRIPIVALTANVMESNRERCRDAGMDDFMPKPIDISLLRKTLERWTPKHTEIS